MNGFCNIGQQAEFFFDLRKNLELSEYSDVVGLVPIMPDEVSCQ